MDHQAQMTSSGNRDLPEGTDERPLITFALFAYNQEEFIREAVEGAFSQTYEPLEVILSDDCSSDSTFDIMKELAATYKGPHRVILRRNRFNLGTALHVQSAFNESKGKLFVVAAGDDISVSKRVMRLYEVWKEAGQPTGVIHSGRLVFSENSTTITELPAKQTAYSGKDLAGFAHGCWLPAAAPTCAYTRDIFERFDPLLGGSIIEDAPLMLRAALIGKFVASDDKLVLQRLHGKNSGSGYSYLSPKRWNRFVISKIIAFRTMQRDLICAEYCSNVELQHKIEARLLDVIRSSSKLLISETKILSPLSKAKSFFRISLSPAISGTIANRVSYALSFLGFEFHLRAKDAIKNLAKRRVY